MLDLQELKSTIQNNYDSSPSGCRCIFIPISKDKGLKIYYDKEIRDKIYCNQKMAAQHGLGPETYDKFEIELDEEIKINWVPVDVIYGYITERVEVFSNEQEAGRIYGSWRVYCNKMDEEYPGVREQLTEELANIYGFYDNHWFNIGRKNGKFICIDFD